MRPKRFSTADEKVLHVLAFDPLSVFDLGDGLPVAAIEREGDPGEDCWPQRS
jgi:hypothetical protein